MFLLPPGFSGGLTPGEGDFQPLKYPRAIFREKSAIEEHADRGRSYRRRCSCWGQVVGPAARRPLCRAGSLGGRIDDHGEHDAVNERDAEQLGMIVQDIGVFPEPGAHAPSTRPAPPGRRRPVRTARTGSDMAAEAADHQHVCRQHHATHGHGNNPMEKTPQARAPIFRPSNFRCGDIRRRKARATDVPPAINTAQR